MNALNPLELQDVVRRALMEDLGHGDMTSESTVGPGVRALARMVAKAEGRIAGLEVAQAAFTLIDPGLDITFIRRDGDDVVPGDEILTVHGSARSILSAERVALNFIQRLSGIATTTRLAVRGTTGTKAMIVDTRKTTPGLRFLEKYAVRVGGGRNHRFGLDDAVMIKENHIAVAGGITAAVTAARQRIGHMHKIEVEIERIDQIDEALQAGADAILLDNMDPATMKEAVRKINGRAIVEASGGIKPEDVRHVAETGVDVISLGWITHSAPALDISLLVVPSV